MDDEDEVSGKAQAVRLRLAAVGGLLAAIRELVQACEAAPERGLWGSWADFFASVAEAVFDAETALEARDAASRLQGLAVLGEEVDLSEATAVLRESLAGSRVPIGRVGRDGVAVLTPLEVRGLGFHTVVFTGLAEGGFPSRGRPDPLLGDTERRRITQALGVRLPLSEQRDAESLLLFAFACEAARDRLVLLAPRSGAADGRPRLPSRLLLRLASRAAGRPVGLDEFLGGEALRPVWRRLAGSPAFSDDVAWVDERERDVALLLALDAAGRRGAARSYAAAVLGDEDAADRRFAAWRSSRSPVPGAWDGLFGAEARAALAATHPFDAEMHPTRLERFVSCPFSFLLRDLYGLQAPDEPGDSLEMDALEFGDAGARHPAARLPGGDRPRTCGVTRRRRPSSRRGGSAAPRPRPAASPVRRCRGRYAASCFWRTSSRPCVATRCSTDPTAAPSEWSGASERLSDDR